MALPSRIWNGRVLFIDALNEVTRERSTSYLKPEHQERIA